MSKNKWGYAVQPNTFCAIDASTKILLDALVGVMDTLNPVISVNVNEVVEFHFDIGDKGSILIYPGTPDEVDKRLNNVIANYFGSQGIQGRADLYNVATLAQAGIPYRLVEVYGGWDNSDIDKFNSQIDNLANDLANAIVGGSSPRQNNNDCWAILPNVTEINTPLITGIAETGYLFKGRDTRNKKFVWSGQKDGKLNTFVKAKTSSWTPGCGQGNGSELGYVKYKKVDEFLGEVGTWYNVKNEDIWLVSHVNGQDQFKVERV
jgi:hypothetical protein